MDKRSGIGRPAMRAVLATVLTVGAVTLWAPATNAGEAVRVTKAEWRSGRSQLRVEGTAGSPDSVVLVRDADTRALLGSAAVRADGKWLLKLRNPKNVPCRTSVEVDGRFAECDVKNAPPPR